MTLLKGKDVSISIDKKTTTKLETLKKKNIFPKLAILRVGENPSDISYEKSVIKKGGSLGIDVITITLDSNITQEKFDLELTMLNNDPTIHGILMFRPLPAQLDNEKARKMLNPKKDIDGCTDLALAGVFTNTKIGFAPCTASAVIEILDYYNIEITSKKIVVIGRSLVIGKPVSMLLLNRNATVTMVHSKTEKMSELARNADIVIVAIGKMESIGNEYFKEGQIVIDVGINFNPIKGKLCGDVKYEEVEPIVEAITPVPGGVGSVTTSVLLNNVVTAAERVLENEN